VKKGRRLGSHRERGWDERRGTRGLRGFRQTPAERTHGRKPKKKKLGQDSPGSGNREQKRKKRAKGEVSWWKGKTRGKGEKCKCVVGKVSDGRGRQHTTENHASGRKRKVGKAEKPKN